ncbi:MAG: exonuclease domain-containing protein [Candidatus Nomurabacteria bacterium]|nr:exonuclease domain-containing protein [Candidatus Nomurabacteria bacterium]
MNYKPFFLDTETTGTENKDRLTQVAYSYAPVSKANSTVELFKPPVPITVASMAVTHITNKMVADKEPFQSSSIYDALKTELEKPETIMVAHNARFDIDMLEREGLSVPRHIDTLRVARYLDPQGKIESYRLQNLRYLLDLDADITETVQAHDAFGDIVVLEKLFDRLFAKMQKQMDGADETAVLDEMMAISLRPSLIHSFNFGKHMGKTIADVAGEDRGYLEWLLKQKKENPTDEEDWIFTLEKYLT